MGASFAHDDPQAGEREIRALSDQSGVPLVQVRTLFRLELKRLGMGAKVGSYLAVLTTSNVRGMLRRRARLAGAVQPVQERNAARAPREQRHLQRWEDDGGRVRRAH
jgi:hypothetical protein